MSANKPISISKQRRSEFIQRLIQCQQSRDIEEAHSEADNVLCSLLVELGYIDIVLEYHKIDKWFA